jgi:DNA mismatch endonuclease (patch repair protein)
MSDIFSNEKRSWIMGRVHGKNTSPELKVRSLLHHLRFRFRLHRKDLPGNPDIVFPVRKKIIFVHGCFWHGHDCTRGKRKPKSNPAYWIPKIDRNKSRDNENLLLLQSMGWKVLVVWECELKDPEHLTEQIRNFLDLEPENIMKLLRLSEAAEAISIGVSTLKKWIDEDKLPKYILYKLPNGQLRIDEEGLREALQVASEEETKERYIEESESKLEYRRIEVLVGRYNIQAEEIMKKYRIPRNEVYRHWSFRDEMTDRVILFDRDKTPFFETSYKVKYRKLPTVYARKDQKNWVYTWRTREETIIKLTQYSKNEHTKEFVFEQICKELGINL